MVNFIYLNKHLFKEINVASGVCLYCMLDLTRQTAVKSEADEYVTSSFSMALTSVLISLCPLMAWFHNTSVCGKSYPSEISTLLTLRFQYDIFTFSATPMMHVM